MYFDFQTTKMQFTELIILVNTRGSGPNSSLCPSLYAAIISLVIELHDQYLVLQHLSDPGASSSGLVMVKCY